MSNHTTIHLLKAQREAATLVAKECAKMIDGLGTGAVGQALDRYRESRAEANGAILALTSAINAWEEEHRLLREMVQEIARYSSIDGISHQALDHIERIIRQFEQ